MIVLQILGGIALLILCILVLAYFFKPELLTLPFSRFISLFMHNPPFVDKERYFPESKLLEENWEEIRAELRALLQHQEKIPQFHEVDNIQRYISAKDDIPWRIFGLKAFDTWIETNTSQAPFTTGLLKKMSHRVTLAMFSILDGGKHIPRHFGFYRGVFRYHLGLIVPEDAPCYIVCGGEKYQWKEGEGVLFDDTYWHEVWNKSQQRRVVLFLDVFREESIPAWLRPLNRKMYMVLARSERFNKAAKNAEVYRNAPLKN